MILAGNITCSSPFPDGRALVLPYKDGQMLAYVWDGLNVREECEQAIRILRSLSIYVPDAGKHIVRYGHLGYNSNKIIFTTTKLIP